MDRLRVIAIFWGYSLPGMMVFHLKKTIVPGFWHFEEIVAI
ncbi:hypothetical protein [Ammoniphilus sp. 3BR4]